MEKVLQELVFIVEEAPEGGFVAKALGPSIVTEADDLESLKRQVADAVQCHFAGTAQMPHLIRLHMVKDELLRL